MELESRCNRNTCAADMCRLTPRLLRRAAWWVGIAATALEHGLTLVTRNVKDFEDLGVTILNPWHAV